MAKARQILFRIFYSTSFTIVFLLLLGFICVSPADTLYESYRRRRLIDIFLIAGAYVATGLIAALIYASRLYTHRSVLKDIPKTYMPVDRDELPTKRTWKLISEALDRSAVIAHQAKPRSTRIEHESPDAGARIAAVLNPESGRSQGYTFDPSWGTIEHRGWSSPAASELPDLEYATVIAELTDLIEAKAVSLTPKNPLSTPSSDEDKTPDPRLIEVLTRPNSAGMRTYVTQLMALDVVPATDLTTDFIKDYERARFAPNPISASEFQSLMRMFAELLRSMQPIDPDALDLDLLSSSSFSDTNADEESDSHSLANSKSTFSPDNSPSASIRHFQPRRMSEDSVPSLGTDEDARSLRTAPTTRAKSTPNAKRSSRNRNPSTSTPTRSSQRRFVSAQSRPGALSLQQQLSQTSLASSRSTRSGRSARSTYSNTGSVVVRLNDERSVGDLPYTIEILPVTRGPGPVASMNGT